jgi:hypothetical protein
MSTAARDASLTPHAPFPFVVQVLRDSTISASSRLREQDALGVKAADVVGSAGRERTREATRGRSSTDIFSTYPALIKTRACWRACFGIGDPIWCPCVGAVPLKPTPAHVFLRRILWVADCRTRQAGLSRSKQLGRDSAASITDTHACSLPSLTSTPALRLVGDAAAVRQLRVGAREVRTLVL